jgi:hypothetical protein
MRAPVSVLIPALNAQSHLPKLLASLFEGLDAGLVREVIVSDGGSSDETCEIASEAGCDVVQAERGRGQQICEGLTQTGGDWCLILHADAELSPGWSNEFSKYLLNKSIAWHFRLRFSSPVLMSRLTSTWANIRSSYFGLPYGDQGLLISKELLNSVNGYSHIALMEDVDMSLRLKGRLKTLPLVLLTDAQRYEKNGWLIQGAKNIWRLTRYMLGVSPEILAKDYQDLEL